MEQQQTDPAAPAKPKRKSPARRARVNRTTELPEEFSEFMGLTPKSCCDACVKGREQIDKAQGRLNEMERMYPRGPSLRPMSPTVMEGDVEWIDRIVKLNKPMADKIRAEFEQITIGLKGACHLTREGTGVCGHPYLNAAQPLDQSNPTIVARRKRALRMLSRIMDARRDA